MKMEISSKFMLKLMPAIFKRVSNNFITDLLITIPISEPAGQN